MAPSTSQRESLAPPPITAQYKRYEDSRATQHSLWGGGNPVIMRKYLNKQTGQFSRKAEISEAYTIALNTNPTEIREACEMSGLNEDDATEWEKEASEALMTKHPLDDPLDDHLSGKASRKSKASGLESWFR